MIYKDITFNDYLKLPGLNSSKLKPYIRSPRYGFYKESTEFKGSSAMNIGTLAHAFILEGEERFHDMIKDEFISEGYPVNPKTKKPYGQETILFKSWYDNQDTEKRVIYPEDIKKAIKIVRAVSRHKTSNNILKRCNYREIAVTWTCKKTGVLCKALIDACGEGIAVDLKTIGKPLILGILEKELFDRQYYMQFSFYADGLHENGIDPDEFYVIFAQNNEENDVGCFEVNYSSMEQGRSDYIKAIGNYQVAHNCEGAQKPGAYPGIESITIPYYAIKDDPLEYVQP